MRKSNVTDDFALAHTLISHFFFKDALIQNFDQNPRDYSGIHHLISRKQDFFMLSGQVPPSEKNPPTL